MTVIRNFTPHPVVLFAEDESGDTRGSVGFGPQARTANFRTVVRLESEGNARATQADETVGSIEVEGDTVNVVFTTFGNPVDLPDAEEGVKLVVSLITAKAADGVGRGTEDLLITSNPVRNAEDGPDKGKIMGCTQFATLAP